MPFLQLWNDEVAFSSTSSEVFGNDKSYLGFVELGVYCQEPCVDFL